MKQVLFITYYWPPSGKASLHWPLNIIKYLPQFEWQPSVLTVNEDTFSQKDDSLLNEIDPALNVIKTKTFEPFNIYKKFIGKPKEDQLNASETISQTNKSITHKISVWIRMNLFIPDARVGWYFYAIKEGRKLLWKNKFDAIISIGPPHTSHLVGNSFSKIFKISHYPVFIDPWVDIVYYKNFKRSKLTLAIDKHFEKKVLKNCKHAIFVTKTMLKDYVSKYKILEKKSKVLYWGYSEKYFSNLTNTPKSDEKAIVHSGNIFDYQNPKEFWKIIKRKIDQGEKIKLKFIGTVGPMIKQNLNEIGLTNYTEYMGFLSYNEMLNELNNADYLLVCATEKRHVPGKLFEYLRIGKPIIAFGDDNEEIKNILTETNSGMIFNYNENGKEFFEKPGQFKTDFSIVKKFDRKKITEELSKILNNIT